MLFSNRPRIYAVYINPAASEPHESAEFIEESISWWGFFFHTFWCFYHKLWWHGLAIMTAWSLLVAQGSELGFSVLTVGAFEMVIRLLVALEGNNWRQSQLRRNGYILADIVTGDGEIAAKLRFYQRWLEQQPTSISARIRPA